MNTRLGKSFGLAFVVAVGILALMFALGTFSAQKAGAYADEAILTTSPAEPGPGAAVAITLELTLDDTTIFDIVTITLPDFGIPSSIDERSISVRTGDVGGPPDTVDTDGDNVILELGDINGDVAGDGLKSPLTIVLKKSAGITAPTAAGDYTVQVLHDDQETAIDATPDVTIARTVSVDPGKGGSGTEVTVSGKAFASGSGTLFSQAKVDPDFNEDGIYDALVDGSENDAAENPTGRSPGDYTLDVNGDGVGDYQLRLEDNVVVADDQADPPVEASDGTDEYVAVPLDAADIADLNDLEAVDLGYTIALGGADTEKIGVAVADAPVLDAPEEDPERSSLKSVSASDGAFETTIEAGDLDKRLVDGRSIITFRDSNGDEAKTAFTVTGTTTLGSDSVGKGKSLKISLSDWVGEVPADVKIDGESLNIEKANGDDLPLVIRDEDNAATFYVTISADVGLGTKTVVLFDAADERLDSASVEITAVDLTVSPSTAAVGQEVTITGSGFTGNVVSIKVGKAYHCETVPTCGIAVASGGRVVSAFDIPNHPSLAKAGDYSITLTDSGGRIGTGTVSIPERTLTVNPAESRVGSPINLSGTGWPTGTGANLVAILYDGIQYSTAITDSDGTWSASISVPATDMLGSTNDVEAQATVGGDDAPEDPNVSQKGEHKTPDPEVILSSERAQRGTTITVSGANFHVFETVLIEIGDSIVTPSPAPTTDGDGSFSAEVLVPGLALGNKNVRVTVNGIPVVEFLEVVATPVSTSMTSEEAFADLVAMDNLIVVWYFDNDTKGWSFYDPRPEVAAAVDLTMVNSGDIVWIQVGVDQDFPNATPSDLSAGWNQVTIN